MAEQKYGQMVTSRVAKTTSPNPPAPDVQRTTPRETQQGMENRTQAEDGRLKE